MPIFSTENLRTVALVGHGGSGKTTLLNAIAGYIDYKGEILLAQKNLNALPP